MKGAIFDLDGTLVNSLIFWNYFWKKVGEKYLNNPDFMPTKEDDKAARTIVVDDSMELIHKNYGVASDSHELIEYCNSLLRDFYKNKVLEKEGVTEFLRAMKKRGVKMCVASASKKNMVRLALKSCNIEDYFTDVVTCAELGVDKSRPDVYVKALEVLGTKLEDTVVFEDSLTAIKSAKGYGFKCVGIYDDNNFGQDEIKKIADVYLEKNESFAKLIDLNI